MSRKPVAVRRRINSSFVAVGTTCFSFCSPSRGPRRCERRSCCGLLEFNKLGAVGDLIARRHVKADDLALFWRGDGVLHLHGLENQKRRSLLDDGAGLGHQGDDLAGHGRSQPSLDVIALSADVERVDKRERP